MGNVSREIDKQRVRNSKIRIKKMLGKKKTVTKMKSTFGGHISVLKIAKERGVSLMKGQ